MDATRRAHGAAAARGAACAHLPKKLTPVHYLTGVHPALAVARIMDTEPNKRLPGELGEAIPVSPTCVG